MVQHLGPHSLLYTVIESHHLYSYESQEEILYRFHFSTFSNILQKFSTILIYKLRQSVDIVYQKMSCFVNTFKILEFLTALSVSQYELFGIPHFHQRSIIKSLTL